MSLLPLPGFIQLTYEPCALTLDDSPNVIRAKMPCGHVIDPHAMKYLCESSVSSGDYEIKCPKCPKVWDYPLIRHVLRAVMTDGEVKEIGRKINSNYCSRARTQTCPQCHSVSMRDYSKKWFDDKTRVMCIVCSAKPGETVEFCWRCGKLWKDNGSGSCGNSNCEQSTSRVLETLATCPLKKVKHVDGCPSIRACPACGLLIEYLSQCKHMRCTHCKCDFCFVCLKTTVNGEWQCGHAYDVCPVAARQTSLA